MQQRPNPERLLQAVARFLSTELAGATSDRALRFRVLIAANLVGQVAAELAVEDQLLSEELAALADLLDRDLPELPPGRGALREAVADGDRALARRIRDGEVDPTAARDHLMSRLAAYLEATDPKFDLARTIE